MGIINQHDKRTNITYVYQSTSYWDKTKKQPRAKRTLIGKRDPTTNQIIPTDQRNKKHQQNKTQTTNNNNNTPPPTIINRKFYGATYLLDQITQKLHIEEDLKQCFPQTHKQILSIAYYLTLEDNSPLYRFEKWSQLHQHPNNQNLTSQRTSEIFSNITENQKNQFLKQFANRHTQNEYWLYDTTTISSYSQTLKQVKYGKNKEHDKLPQLNLALVYGQDTNLPFYYRKMAGNISDVTTLKGLLSDLENLELEFARLKLTMDRGFYSKSNIDAMLKDHREFIIGVKLSLKFVREALDQVCEKFTTFEYYSEQYELYSTTVPLTWDSGQVFSLHLFYNIDRAAEDKKAFDRRLAARYRELVLGKPHFEHAKCYEKYFRVEQLVEGGVRVVVNEVAVGLAKRYFGFFALLSSEVMDSVVALELYRNKDLVEKAFGNVKERLNLRRALVSSEQCLDGKLFVCYIGLIFLSYLKRCMQVAGLFVHYTMQSMFDCLDVIECFEYPGQPLRVGEVTDKQKQLYKALKISPPT